MDQVKIGFFLKELRKEKHLTQEDLAEELHVSNRTISRWETGTSLPDINMLVMLSDFYAISIPELISGERKEKMRNQESNEMAHVMAAYSHNEIKAERRKMGGFLILIFGIFIILSALIIFPSESSWSSIYAILGSFIVLFGLCIFVNKRWRVQTVVGCMFLLFILFTLSDYVAVTQFNQVPRFRYETSYDSRKPNQWKYKTLFFTAIQTNPGTRNEKIEIQK
ncbi:MAG: helix-turn-helix transcriptional regulator [Absicoccus porci]|uniref:helix-turn-helix domain-containing protein n=1 Tax=Absicoccus porci TaxID=2486576 RepID=UPI002409E8EB|nr:helix-turn-helix transcriptional regulator [Absicoccus porci]MDD6460805.1 helix-turn-helix transcriptional regulator [Absicoccus porci]